MIITFKMNGDTADKLAETGRLLADAMNNFKAAPVVPSTAPPPIG